MTDARDEYYRWRRAHYKKVAHRTRWQARWHCTEVYFRYGDAMTTYPCRLADVPLDGRFRPSAPVHWHVGHQFRNHQHLKCDCRPPFRPLVAFFTSLART